MENNKNQLIPINNSLANFERQITIGEKLLGIKLSDSEKERIKKFLIEIVSNNYDIIQIISSRFPLTEKLIDKFKYKLNWSALCRNDSVVWTEELIDEYFELIDWESISENSSIEWSEKLLHKYSNYLNFNSVFFNDNPSLKLTLTLYKEFKDKIDIEDLSYVDIELFPKEFIKDNIGVLDWENLKSYTIENLEIFQEKINWDDLSKSEKLTLTDKLIERFKNKWTWDDIIKIERKNGIPTYIRIFETHYFDGTYANIYYDAEIVIDEELLDSINRNFVWSHLSRDTNFKNNYSLIEKFENKWDWTLLTYNNSIEWTSELIEKHKNKIDWEVFSLNPNLQWSEELIELYHDYWDWKILGMNTYLPWSLAFYKKYEHKFQEYFLFFHKEAKFSSDDFYKSNYRLMNYFVDYHFEKHISQVQYDSNLIFYVKDILHWSRFSGTYEWSLVEIEKYKEYINWDALSRNRNLNWSFELLKKYEDKWDWEGIGRNKSVVNFDLSLLTKFVKHIKENDHLSHLKIKNLFLKFIDKNDVIKILENYQSNQLLNISK